jgi:hypothetical protein
MATSPIYSWPEPDNTDLVKNGALAIRTLGNAIDTTMATMTPKSLVDAKGDLIAASANDTPARLAVGANGETLVADSSASVGIRYQSAYNGNAIINGGFDIWQRGTSFTAANAYTADRWAKDEQTVSTVSRQTTSDTTNLPTIQYCARVQRTAASTSTGNQGLIYTLETADSIRFAGQAVVVSFYARAGANYSAASSALSYNFFTGTGTDQRRSFPVGFTGEANIASATKTLTTTWQRFSFTATVGATATELALMFLYAPVGTAGANDYFEITGVQLELGSVPTTFKRSNGSGGTIQGELSAAQRYYTRFTGGQAYTRYGYAVASSGTGLLGVINLPVTLRTNPSSIDFSNLAVQQYGGQPIVAVTNCTLEGTTQGLNTFTASLTIASGGVTGSMFTLMNNNNTAGYIGVSAEL